MYSTRRNEKRTGNFSERRRTGKSPLPGWATGLTEPEVEFDQGGFSIRLQERQQTPVEGFDANAGRVELRLDPRSLAG
jgi:hypothetical protein